MFRAGVVGASAPSQRQVHCAVRHTDRRLRVPSPLVGEGQGGGCVTRSNFLLYGTVPESPHAKLARRTLVRTDVDKAVSAIPPSLTLPHKGGGNTGVHVARPTNAWLSP